jgi:hypothetical protein
VDGDGVPDLVVANNTSKNMSVLLNQGNGTFAPAIYYSIASGGSPNSVAVADLDGDGLRDIVVASQGSNDVSVFMNQGNGTFAAGVSYSAGTDALSLTAADLNGDGKPDLAAAGYGGVVIVLLNQGAGSFSPPVEYIVEQNAYPSLPVVAAADLNGDGKVDLAVAGHRMSVLLNQGDGTFTLAAGYGAGVGAYAIVAADLNADGMPDLAVANYSANGGMTVLLTTCLP